jgi:hypothetical protein
MTASSAIRREGRPSKSRKQIRNRNRFGVWVLVAAALPQTSGVLAVQVVRGTVRRIAGWVVLGVPRVRYSSMTGPVGCLL